VAVEDPNAFVILLLLRHLSGRSESRNRRQRTSSRYLVVHLQEEYLPIDYPMIDKQTISEDISIPYLAAQSPAVTGPRALVLFESERLMARCLAGDAKILAS